MDYSELFTPLGKVVQLSSTIGTALADHKTGAAELLDSFNSNGLQTSVESFGASARSFQASLRAERQSLVQYATARLRDKAVRDWLGIVSTSLSTIHSLLYTKMAADGESVKETTVSIGSPTAIGSPSGNGTILVGRLLDGITDPGAGMGARTGYAGALSQLCTPQTVRLRCDLDPGSPSYAGAESFVLEGDQSTGKWDAGGSRGAGGGVSLYTMAYDPVFYSSFDSAVAGVPSGWTLSSGTGGVHTSLITASPYKGAGSLKLIGDGIVTNVTLSRPIAQVVESRTAYRVAFAMKGGGTPETGVLSVSATGTGYSAPAGQSRVILYPDWPGSWAVYWFDFVTPPIVPADFAIRVQLSNPSENAFVQIDEMIVSQPTWYDGLSYAIYPGPSPFLLGDAWSVAITTPTVGLFQDFFVRGYGAQLPSSSSPTVSESLAQ